MNGHSIQKIILHTLPSFRASNEASIALTTEDRDKHPGLKPGVLVWIAKGLGASCLPIAASLPIYMKVSQCRQKDSGTYIYAGGVNVMFFQNW